MSRLHGEGLEEAYLITNQEYDAIILNFANPDMVGHTGILKSAIQAIEVVDKCVGKISSKAKESGAAVFLTADHGNLEMMINPKTGEAHTNHTTLPVPFILDCNNKRLSLEKFGLLADIAPTILEYLDIEKPIEMTGKSLLKNI